MFTDHARSELFKTVGQSGGHALDGRQEGGCPCARLEHVPHRALVPCYCQAKDF